VCLGLKLFTVSISSLPLTPTLQGFVFLKNASTIIIVKGVNRTKRLLSLVYVKKKKLSKEKAHGSDWDRIFVFLKTTSKSAIIYS